MADLEDKTVPELTAIDTPESGDLVNVVDVSDSTDAATGSSKKSTLQQIADWLASLTQTLTNKRLTLPKLNEDVAVTASATEINQLDGNTLSGNNTGDETTSTLGTKINAATDKTPPIDADLIPLTDSTASHIIRKLTWANVKAALKTYFDSLTTTLTNKTLTSPKINEDVALTVTATQLNAVGTGGVTTRLKSKVLQITRDLAAETGDVSYTGAGFAPSSVFAMAASGGATISFGIGDSAKTNNALKKDGDSTNYYNNTSTFGACLVFFSPTSGNRQSAIIKTWDADGLTLTWTKTGSPTGTLTINLHLLG